MNKLPEHITEAMLVSYFTKQAETEEESVIESWLSESQENLDLFNTLKIIWADTGLVTNETSDQKELNVNAAWNKIQRKRERVKRPVYYSIAASLLLLIGIFIFYPTKENVTTYVNNATSPQLLTLQDGSEILVNSSSGIQYPTVFSSDERKISFQGEAFFEIEKLPNKPFIIEMGETQIEVLGTSFNISTNKTLDSIAVDVVTGKVLFTAINKEMLLQKGEKAIFRKTDLHFEKSIPETSGATHFWRTKLLNFNGNELSEVVAILNDAYNTKIELADSSIATCRFSSAFSNESLDYTLEIIAETLDLEISKTEDAYLLDGEGCGD